MTQDSLKTRMQSEARGDTPEFSRLLHERIMSKVRAEGRVKNGRAGARRGYRRWPMAAAASVLVAVSLSIPFLKPALFHPRPEIPSPTEISEPVDRILTSAAAPARETFDEAKYAYLDQDAKRLMVFLADQLPSPPTPGEPPPR